MDESRSAQLWGTVEVVVLDKTRMVLRAGMAAVVTSALLMVSAPAHAADAPVASGSAGKGTGSVDRGPGSGNTVGEYRCSGSGELQQQVGSSWVDLTKGGWQGCSGSAVSGTLPTMMGYCSSGMLMFHFYENARGADGYTVSLITWPWCQEEESGKRPVFESFLPSSITSRKGTPPSRRSPEVERFDKPFRADPLGLPIARSARGNYAVAQVYDSRGASCSAMRYPGNAVLEWMTDPDVDEAQRKAYAARLFDQFQGFHTAYGQPKYARMFMNLKQTVTPTAATALAVFSDPASYKDRGDNPCGSQYEFVYPNLPQEQQPVQFGACFVPLDSRAYISVGAAGKSASFRTPEGSRQGGWDGARHVAPSFAASGDLTDSQLPAALDKKFRRTITSYLKSHTVPSVWNALKRTGGAGAKKNLIATKDDIVNATQPEFNQNLLAQQAGDWARCVKNLQDQEPPLKVGKEIPDPGPTPGSGVDLPILPGQETNDVRPKIPTTTVPAPSGQGVIRIDVDVPDAFNAAGSFDPGRVTATARVVKNPTCVGNMTADSRTWNWTLAVSGTGSPAFSDYTDKESTTRSFSVHGARVDQTRTWAGSFTNSAKPGQAMKVKASGGPYTTTCTWPVTIPGTPYTVPEFDPKTGKMVDREMTTPDKTEWRSAQLTYTTQVVYHFIPSGRTSTAAAVTIPVVGALPNPR